MTYALGVSGFFHVSSVLNRESIERFGLDSARMGAAPGIAGSREPEADGVFVCIGDHHVDFFVGMNNTGGPVDVWSVLDVDESLLRDNGSGFFYLPGSVPPARVRILRRDVSHSPRWAR
jgi:hypothetical protein